MKDLEKDSQWILAKNLSKFEKLQTTGELDAGSDFGSYRLLNLGKGNNQIEAHCTVGKASVLYVKFLKSVFLKYFINFNNLKIADLGCGPGFVSKEIAASLNKSTVYGYDLSNDGIQYAQKNFPNCKFQVLGIEPDTDYQIKFDIIHAKEFYPFTRTASKEFHCSYITGLLKNLSPEGIITIMAPERSTSIIQNLNYIQERIKDFASIEKYLEPKFKILKYISNIKIATLFTALLCKLLNYEKSYV